LIVHKLSLSTVFLVLVSAGVVGGIFYSETTNLLVDNALEDIAVKIRNAGSRLQVRAKSQHADALILVDTPPIQDMLRAREKSYDSQGKSTHRQWLQRIQSIFTTLLKSKPAYRKLRVINKDDSSFPVEYTSAPVRKNEKPENTEKTAPN